MPNDTCASAIDLTGMTTYSASINTTAFAAAGVTIPCGSSPTGPKSAWWIYTNTAPGLQFVSIDTGGSSYFNDISIWTGACGSLTNIACKSQSYASHSTQTGVSVAPLQTVTIIVTDDGTGAGGTLAISITMGTNDPMLAFGNNFNDNDLTPLSFFNGTTGAFEGTADWGSNGSPLIGSFCRQPVLGNWFSAKGVDTAIIQKLGTNFQSTSTVNVASPSTNWEGPQLLFAMSGELFLCWSGIPGTGNRGHQALQQLDPTTFGVIQTWQDFNGAMIAETTGISITSCTLSPDGTIFYYTTSGGTGADQNQIYKLVLLTGTNSVLATFGTYSGGVNATGDAFAGNHTLATFANGNLLAISTHQTTGSLDNATALIITPAGSITTNVALTSWPATTRPTGLTLADSDVHFWVSSTGTTLLDQYNLSVSRLIHTTPPAGPDGDDRDGWGLVFFANGGATPVPPPTGTARAMRCVRTFQIAYDGNLMVFLNRLEVLCQQGVGLSTGQGSAPLVMFRLSRDGGFTWGNEIDLSLGATGAYGWRSYVNRLGRGRNLVGELSVSDPVFAGFLEVLIDGAVGTS